MKINNKFLNIFKNFSFEILTIILFNRIKSNSFVKFNLEYVPKTNQPHIEDKIKSPEETVQELYYKDFITKIEIGTPPRDVPLFINLNDAQFYFTCPNDSIINNANNNYYNFTYKELFNESLSFSYLKENCYHSYNPLLKYIEICDAKDNILLNINNKNSIQEEFPIKIVRNREENVPGYLGLLFNSSSNCIVSLLKQKNIISDYYFFINFVTINPLENKIDGQLVIGILPHEIFPNKYSFDNYIYTSAYTTNFISEKWRLAFDEIYINDKYEKYKFLNTLISFSYEIYPIIGTFDMKREINSLFLEELIEQKKCFSGSFPQNINGLKNSIIFYYCEKTVKNILYEKLKNIKFYSSKLEYVFELTNEELFYIKDDYIYLNIVFKNIDENCWTMGQIFTTKYNFVFNTDKKQIGLYKSINNDKVYNKSNKNNIVIIFCFTICILICICLGIIIARKIFGLNRKIIANELIEELNYEYKIENNTVKPNLNRNKNDVNKEYIFEMKNKN